MVKKENKIKTMRFNFFLFYFSDVPMFVQLGESWRQIFAGVCQNSDVRTNFEMVHLKNRPPKCGHLASLLDSFKEKVVQKLEPNII